MSMRPLTFPARADAGRQLSAALPALDRYETVVIALPRGGVPVAAEICTDHDLPMDLLLVRKIGAPGQPELAVGAVTDGEAPGIIVNTEIALQFRLSKSDVEEMALDLLPEIERRKKAYLAGRVRAELAGKTVVVVDDGVATGATLRASLRALKATGPGRVIVALPVGPSDLKARLRGLADLVICLSDIRFFRGVGGAYRSFPQVDDAEVRGTLSRFAPKPAG